MDLLHHLLRRHLNRKGGELLNKETPLFIFHYVKTGPELMYLQVKGLDAWRLNLHSEASVLNNNHFLLIGVITSIRISAAVLLGLCLLGLVMSSLTIHYCCSCTVGYKAKEIF